MKAKTSDLVLLLSLLSTKLCFSKSALTTILFLGESKGADSGVAFFKVHRSMGSYGSAAVSWKLLPGDTNDVAPTTGVLEFRDGETEV